MRVADIVRHFVSFFYKGETFTLMVWVILSLRKLLQKGVEIGERQNRCHDESRLPVSAFHLRRLRLYHVMICL